MQGCRGTYDFGVASVSGVNIEIDRGTAWPGVYSIQLPVKVAYEENKGNYDGKMAEAGENFLYP